MLFTQDIELVDKVKQICEKHSILELKFKNMIPEPYAPYIPENWNEFLVLAEAQQLRGNTNGNKKYVNSLKNEEKDEQIFRLGNEKITNQKPEKMIGILPWDKGYIKIAMLSCFPEYSVEEYGLSNAVPWHLQKNKTEQATILIKKSIEFWNDILPLIKPKVIICTGKIAYNVICETNYNCNKYKIRSASQLGRVINLFNSEDLIRRYPEVKGAIENYEGEISDQYKKYYIFYAAHAVSLIKESYKF